MIKRVVARGLASTNSSSSATTDSGANHVTSEQQQHGRDSSWVDNEGTVATAIARFTATCKRGGVVAHFMQRGEYCVTIDTEQTVAQSYGALRTAFAAATGL